MTTNGHVKVLAPVNPAGSYVSESEALARSIDVNVLNDGQRIALAQVWATLAVAASDERIADDEDRIAGCVPDGLHSFSVSPRGQR